jgi:hypothetical protein
MRTMTRSQQHRGCPESERIPLPEWKDYQHANCCPCHTTRKLAYTLDEAAAKVGCSTSLLRGQIAHGYLVPRYAGAKILIQHDELVDWLHNLPAEPR